MYKVKKSSINVGRILNRIILSSHKAWPDDKAYRNMLFLYYFDQLN